MTRFPSFQQLPVEIQEAIWKAAIPPPRPTVYPATAKVQPKWKNEDGTPGLNTLWRTHLTNNTKDGRSNNNFLTALSSLLVCCKHASSIALAAYQQNKPEFPLLVRGLPHEIDGGCDLLLFQQGWQTACNLGADRIEGKAPRRTLHNFAVQWPGPRLTTPFWVSVGLANILSLWQDLETFYVIVDPEHLAPKPWLPEDERNWARNTTPGPQVLATFLRNYRQDYEKQESNVFYERGREYFEVPTEVVGEAEALEPAAEVVFDAWELLNAGIRYDPETVITRCLILSWREL